MSRVVHEVLEHIFHSQKLLNFEMLRAEDAGRRAQLARAIEDLEAARKKLEGGV